MKKLLISVITVGFLMLPLMVYAQSEQRVTGVPPVSQALVSEGDFALELATALRLGTPSDEAQAEDMLTSADVTPKNGWIADYPVTPNIVGELQDAVANAADSRKLPMGKDEALKAFQDLTTEFGLAILPGSSGEYAENQPQPNPAVIDNYYYDEGPPVVTYYPPPSDYYYLYAWVPYPFWCSGFFFSGFFVLNDFDNVVVVNHHGHHGHHKITNHFINPKTRTVTRVDPVSHTLTHVSDTKAFNSTTTKSAASSLFDRSIQRTTPSRGTQGFTGNHVSIPSGGQSKTFGSSDSSAYGSGMNHSPSQNSGSFGCGNCHGGSGSFGRGGGHSFSGFSGGGHFGGGARR